MTVNVNKNTLLFRIVYIFPKKILIVIFFFNCSIIFSQEQHFSWEGIICEKRNKEFVPDASIKVFSSERVFVFVADNRGKAKISYYRPAATDSILISSIGYKPRKLLCNDLLNLKNIEIEEDIYNLSEIVITPTKKKKRKTIKLGNKASLAPILSHHLGFSTQGVRFIEYENLHGRILKIRYYMKDVIRSEEHYRPFRVRIYDVDTLNNIPGNDLLNEYLIVSLNKKHWIEVNISQYNIELPLKGMFVGMEVLPVEYYYENNVVTPASTIMSKTINGERVITGGVSFGTTRRSKKTKSPYGSWQYYNTKSGWIRPFRQDIDFLIQIVVEKEE